MSDSIRIELPPELIEAITTEVVERVVERLAITSTPEPSPYLTVIETATYLRSSRQRVDDLLSRGTLTRIKDGRRTLVLREEIEQHLARSARRKGR